MSNDALKRRREPSFNVESPLTLAGLQELITHHISGKRTLSHGELSAILQTIGDQSINANGSTLTPATVNATNLNADNISVKNADEGGTGKLTIKTARVVHTLAAAATSATDDLLIPAGAMLLGYSSNNNVAVVTSGATNTYSAAFITGSTTAVATDAAGAINTKVNTLIVPEITTDVTEIEFDAAGAETFVAGGIIEVVVYYAILTSLANV